MYIVHCLMEYLMAISSLMIHVTILKKVYEDYIVEINKSSSKILKKNNINSECDNQNK